MTMLFYKLWYLIVFTLSTIVAGLLCLALSYISKPFTRRITSQGWAYIVLGPARIKVEVTGHSYLPPPGAGGYIIFANHRSILDIPTVAVATGRAISWVAKSALGRIPVFGWTLKRVHLLVDRGGSAEAAKHMIAEASGRLAQGEIMAIFPEGTRNKTESPLLPFKKGAFILAKHTGVPLVPLAIYGSGRLWPSGSLTPKPGLIKVAIGPPITVGPKDTLNNISAAAQDTLSALYRTLEDSEPKNLSESTI
ncbi:MAG: 1-acyl-sn-glycerol-3-phosphate acyltransferase [Deltaproteobacteria bacterium]|jgi:1-acyl-sn-glycerol-3-phosphate acyltransferase|nr:1-acyl-sn-glycerol-3-phosphate acyltransferase [Deltaproteobacteria bacterium]